MIRVFTLLFERSEFLDNVLIGVAAFTILSGALGALIQNNIQKLFSYLIICHIGFMIAGLAMNTTVAFTGTVFI
jgi:multicomponent Na+:H+ antiporter subunit D